MAMTAIRDEHEPMKDLNTTPLIDVMLVLLIMFIITLPPLTHAVKVELPTRVHEPLPAPDSVKNRIAIDAAGVVRWNGTVVDRATLRRYLDQTAAMSPEPELQFQPDPAARYEAIDSTLAVIKRSQVTKLGFVGNEQYYRDF